MIHVLEDVGEIIHESKRELTTSHQEEEEINCRSVMEDELSADSSLLLLLI